MGLEINLQCFSGNALKNMNHYGKECQKAIKYLNKRVAI